MPVLLDKPLIFEREDNLYIVTPVAPFEPTDTEAEEFAYAGDLKKMAPNENLLWLRGRYVEGDRPNENGAEWPDHELEIASLTPMLMPVTRMHDPRTAVGMIADTRLHPKTDDARARIDTTLGIWKHRFPDVAEEIAANYAAGTLMQSMECRHAYYDCGECGTRYPKLPRGAERVNWCSHLRGESAAAGNRRPVRRLGNVTFTGTGLIFGTEGARGAYDEAHLDLLADEVAAFHHESHAVKPRRTRRMDNIEISKTEYAELQALKAKFDGLESKVKDLEETAAKVPGLEKQIEEAEAAKTRAETERDEKAAALTELEETARTSTLAKDRLKGLSAAFMGKLGDFTKSKLEEHAASMQDEEWADRIKELEESTGVKHDEGGTAATANEGLSEEELARAGGQGGGGGAGGQGGNGTGGNVSPERRRSVVGGLVKHAKA